MVTVLEGCPARYPEAVLQKKPEIPRNPEDFESLKISGKTRGIKNQPEVKRLKVYGVS